MKHPGFAAVAKKIQGDYSKKAAPKAKPAPRKSK